MMAQNDAGHGGRTDNKRFAADDVVDVADLIEGDRLAPCLVPQGAGISQDDERSRHYQVDSDKPFLGRVVAQNSRHDDIRHVLVVDDETGTFVRVSAHSSSQAWNQKERDWKVRDIGTEVEVVECWDVDIPDLEEFGETPEEFVETWSEMLFDKIRHGEPAGDEIDEFDGKKFHLRDYDGRRARVQYQLISEGK